MKIGIVKPDWRIRGGFEKVLGAIEQDLIGAGHEIRWFQIDVPTVPRHPFDTEVPPESWDRAPEWFSHLALLEAFRNLDVSWADMVISTQPPSYAVQHPRLLALFYHHARAFYDLEDVWIRAGHAPERLHTRASALLRKSETQDFGGVAHFLAGSERAIERLHQFQGPDVPVSLYQAAGPTMTDAEETARTPEGRFEHVLCVSRHEFTKRTELAVLGIAAAAEAHGVLVGDGGRLPFVRQLAGELAAGLDPHGLADEDVWLNSGIPDGPVEGEHPRIDIAGRVDDDTLADMYRNALCVLAPAYDEDDGLTIVEAMSYGKPVIVLRDGGGLTALVRDGENGLVVAPNASAIAAAIDLLSDDPALARAMGERGRQTARERTPERARAQLLSAVDKVLAG